MNHRIETTSFYIHIPFCRQKCLYCKFALTPRFDSAKQGYYYSFLEKEIEAYFSRRSSRKAKTIYFGGGTPSLLTLAEIERILSHFQYDKETEITLECNPEDVDEAYVVGLRRIGITRISLGVQSLNDETLRAVNRSPSESIYRALDILEGGEWENINIDFILGLPYEAPGGVLSALERLHEKYTKIAHTSVYMLEEGVYPRSWNGTCISEEQIRAEYTQICEYLKTQGRHHYEISNWAKPGYECCHNQNYWNHTEYRGFGLSAGSYEDGLRWENAPSFPRYYRGERENEEKIDREEKWKEAIIFGIRTFHLEKDTINRKTIESYIAEGLVEDMGNVYRLTSAGVFLENTIIRTILAGGMPT